MSISRDEENGCWRFEFDRRIPGKGRIRARKRLPKTWSRAKADAFDIKETARLYAIASGAEVPEAGIEDAVTLYLTERLPELKAGKRTAQELNLIHWAYHGKTLAQLPEVCAAIQKKWAGTLKPATIRNRIRYLTAACRWGWKRHGLCVHDPAARVVVPTVDNERQTYIDRADLVRLARWVGRQERRGRWQCKEAQKVLRVAFYSGMRLGEVLRARPTENGWLLPDTKNGSPRLIPFHHKVKHLARAWPPKVAARTVQSWMARGRSELKLGDLHTHDLRHSTASAMINNDVDLYTVGAVLGHKSSQSTKRYAHLATTRLAAALGKVGKKAA